MCIYVYMGPPKIQQWQVSDQKPAEGEQPPTASKGKSTTNNQQGQISNQKLARANQPPNIQQGP